MGPRVPSAENRVTAIQNVHHQLIRELTKAQQRYKNHADRRRKEHPSFKVGDSVWLLRQNIRTTRPCEKLDHKRLGPFRIAQEINPVTFRLDLPPSLKIHDAFHVSLLEPYHANTLPGRPGALPPPPPIIMDNHEEYEVEAILDSRRTRGKLHYLVHWKGYGINERSWEPESHVANAAETVDRFHRQNPHLPGPTSRHLEDAT
jgi:hypothetical protein